MVIIFAGNIITGEVIHAVVENDDCVISEVIENFCDDLGRENVVWAIYNMAQTIEYREFQFNNYLAGKFGELNDLAAS